MKKHTEQELVRREALKKIQELGINPYPAEEYTTNTTSVDIKQNFSKQEHLFKNIKIAGRIMSRRIMGKASFIELKDFKGRVQVYVNRDEIC